MSLHSLLEHADENWPRQERAEPPFYDAAGVRSRCERRYATRPAFARFRRASFAMTRASRSGVILPAIPARSLLLVREAEEEIPALRAKGAGQHATDVRDPVTERVGGSRAYRAGRGRERASIHRACSVQMRRLVSGTSSGGATRYEARRWALSMPTIQSMLNLSKDDIVGAASVGA